MCLRTIPQWISCAGERMGDTTKWEAQLSIDLIRPVVTHNNSERHINLTILSPHQYTPYVLPSAFFGWLWIKDTESVQLSSLCYRRLCYCRNSVWLRLEHYQCSTTLNKWDVEYLSVWVIKAKITSWTFLLLLFQTNALNHECLWKVHLMDKLRLFNSAW